MTGPVMLDVEGLTLAREEEDRLQNPLVGGVILFSRNFESRSQVADLVAHIRATRSQKILVAVDHEGGRVQRFRAGFSILPAMGTLGDFYQSAPEHGLQVAEDMGVVLAQELTELGLDFSFTPVLDLNYGRSEVIGRRSFGRSPAAVTVLAQALIRGLQAVGSEAVGKHFPGHGFVEADSHHDLPVDERSFEAIERDDLQPFKALAGALAGVMPAHVVYPKVDPAPAGFSRFWLKTVLREALGFQGVIFSDDLAMAGAHSAGSPVDRAQAAFLAGCDMVLLCNDGPNQASFLKGVERLPRPEGAAQRLERFFKSDIREAATRYALARDRLSTIRLEGYEPR